MFAVLSTAKLMDFSHFEPEIEVSTPYFISEAEKLVRTARRLTQKQIRESMKVSADLARQTAERFRAFEAPFTRENAKPAVLSFSGEVYRGFDALSIDSDDLQWAQNHLGIVSGLFGLLRPLDLIQPYRLEMGLRLKTRRGSNLYAFWGDLIADRINELVAVLDEQTIVNLSSAEYFKALRSKKINNRVLTPVFHEIRPGQTGRVIATFAKRARGLMARFIVEHHIDTREGLKEFNLDQYRYQPEESTDDMLLFSRGLSGRASKDVN